MLEFNLFVKSGSSKAPGFQAQPEEETTVVALNPNLIITVCRNLKNDEHTDIVCGAMTVTTSEGYESVKDRIMEFNMRYVYQERDSK